MRTMHTGVHDAAVALAEQGMSLIFKACGNPECPQWTPDMKKTLQAAGTRGVALVRCNHLDKALCDTRAYAPRRGLEPL